MNSAVDRARLALQVVQHLSVGEENGNVEIGNEISAAAARETVELIREFVKPVVAEENEYAGETKIKNISRHR